jgi:purine-binding chemotaxis protein CheW
MSDLFLIADISGSLVAIDSSRVESVVRIGEVLKVANCSPLVSGLFALRSRVLTLIDSQYLITGHSKTYDVGSLAVVVEINGHTYGLLVDRIEDAVMLGNLEYLENVSVDTNWQKISSGVVLHNDRMLMVINLEQLIAEPEQLAA